MVHFRGGADIPNVQPAILAATISTPVLIVHGNEDKLISHSRGQDLFQSFPGQKRFLTVTGGTHSNVLITDAPVYATMADWLLSE